MTTAVITAPASLTFATRAAFKQAALDALAGGASVLVFDCTAMDYADATGLGAMIAVRHQVVAAGGMVVVAGLNEDMAALMIVTDISALFVGSETLDQATEMAGRIAQGAGRGAPGAPTVATPAPVEAKPAQVPAQP